MNWKISLAFSLILLFVAGCGETIDRNEKTSEYYSTRCLAEVEELGRAGVNWKLIDLRKPEEFSEGHLPGALNVWRTEITDTSYPYGGMMPTQAQMELLLSELGITATDTILIYDNKAACDAARLWWILKFYGHPNIKLLNGGLKAWVDAYGQLSRLETNPIRSEYRFTSLPDSSIHASMTMVGRILADTSFVLLDTRGKEEFNGKLKEGAVRGGHIDQAVNLDWAMSVDYNGTMKFLPSDSLKERYAAVGIDGTKPVITYCHSGVRSAHTLFVLTELLGYRNIKNYDGSWIEWSHSTAAR